MTQQVEALYLTHEIVPEWTTKEGKTVAQKFKLRFLDARTHEIVELTVPQLPAWVGQVTPIAPKLLYAGRLTWEVVKSTFQGRTTYREAYTDFSEITPYALASKSRA